MRIPKKYFKELAEIYADYENKEDREAVIMNGLKTAYMMGHADGSINQINKQVKKLEKKI